MDKIQLATAVLIQGKHERLGKESPITILSKWELEHILVEYKNQLFLDEQQKLDEMYSNDFSYGIY